MNFIVATVKSWNINNFKSLRARDKKNRWFLVDDKKNLTLEKIKKINPKYIFFPHWSWIIPEDIYKNYECVVFHMTDLPYGRGGSPLQNLIVRGHKKTKISAIRVVGGLDTGDVYFKMPLTLNGNADEIFRRASKIFFSMMKTIINKKLKPTPQKGKVVSFQRRKPSEGDISGLDSIPKLYDYIRMLDAEGYPSAFLEKNKLRFEFSKATLKRGHLSAEVKISINSYE